MPIYPEPTARVTCDACGDAIVLPVAKLVADDCPTCRKCGARMLLSADARASLKAAAAEAQARIIGGVHGRVLSPGG